MRLSVGYSVCTELIRGKMLAKVISFYLILQLLCPVSAYKHVILMHGLFGSPRAFSEMVDFISETHPGTTFTVIDAYNHVLSLRPMWDQTEKVRDIMDAVMKKHPEGVHMICYSQGGLLCRAIIETLPDHNVHNFISLSAPQGGQYGDTKFLKVLFPLFLKENIYRFFYTEEGQKFSVANYWNDPHHQDLYFEMSEFLAVINNQSLKNHSMSNQFKENFLRLKHLILIGGPDDKVITPWQSSQFAAYDSKEKVLDMRKQSWYINDSFGLRTLKKRHAIKMYSIPGVAHLDWPRNQTVYKNCIEKWLN